MKKTLVLVLALFLVVALGSFAQAAPALDNGLLYYFSFDGNINNTGSTNIQGTLNGTLAYETGKVGQAAAFDGSQQITIPNVDGVTDLSLSFWIKVPSVATDSVPYAIFSSTQWQNGAVHSHVNNGRVAVAFAGWTDDTRLGNLSNEVSYTGVEALENTWINVVFTFDSATGTRKLYVNSTLLDESTGTPPADLLKGEFQIGSWKQDANRNWKGSIDELRVYNRALTEEEVTALSSQGGGVTPLPTPSPTPEVTATPIPTATPLPTVEPQATVTIAPTTMAPTETPAPADADSGLWVWIVIIAIIVLGVVLYIVFSKKKPVPPVNKE